ncbi:MAG: hypothetical protein IK123_01295, partial [Lachnospiraceae bacterium]|nr:hypothetical protein [Lachnospiraceae bacterium]
SAIEIRMFPESFRDRIILSGNTSLSGAVKYSLDPKDIVIPDHEEIYLADEDSFYDLYIENMNL